MPVGAILVFQILYIWLTLSSKQTHLLQNLVCAVCNVIKELEAHKGK